VGREPWVRGGVKSHFQAGACPGKGLEGGPGASRRVE
jgi:hypothetical protein